MTTALGCHVGNPNGNNSSEMAYYEGAFQRFTAQIGKPSHMNAFTAFDDANPIGQKWVDSANWTAWSWSLSPTAKKLYPVVGVPLSDNAHWYPNNIAVFQDIAAGKYDYVWDGIARAWLGLNPFVNFRLGYEHTGNFMPWYAGEKASDYAAFIAAFRQVSKVIRAAGKALGKTARIIWNPNSMGWTACDTASTFPGVDAVDLTAIDTYSPRYPGGLYRWAKMDGSYAPDIASWYGEAGNSEHWWNLPDANEWNPNGTGSGWGWRKAVAFAKAHGLQLAICETGAGNKDASTGPADDAAFPAWLKSAVAYADAQGVYVPYACLWVQDESDGKWGCLDGQQPKTVAAWKACGFKPAA